MLRLMFIKSISMVNGFYYNNRESRSLIPNKIQNIFINKKKLITIWDDMKVVQPTGYAQYVQS